MIIQLLSALDLLVAAILAYSELAGGAHWVLLVYAASYLLVKAVIFWSNWMSWGDALVGAWLVLVLLGASGPISWLAVAWFLYKVVYALTA